MKIAIIDDHAFVRSSIALMLNNLLELVDGVDEADTAQELNYKDTQYNLILLDYYIPGNDPDVTFNILKDNFPNVPILYISSEENPQIILSAINNGAVGYVVKSVDMELFVAVVNLVLSGGKYIPVDLLHQLQLSKREEDKLLSSEKLVNLSNRQRDVFKLLINGNSNKVIADKLNISEYTVKSHVSGIYNTLGLQTRQDVIDQFNANTE